MIDFCDKLSLDGDSGLKTAVQTVDNAGTLKQLSLIVGDYHKKFDDFDELVAKTKDPNEFLNNFVTEIQKSVGDIKTSYKHISIAVDEVLRVIE